jgi:hypothetical protein
MRVKNNKMHSLALHYFDIEGKRKVVSLSPIVVTELPDCSSIINQNYIESNSITILGDGVLTKEEKMLKAQEDVERYMNSN